MIVFEGQRYYTVEEVAKMRGCNKETVRRWLRNGKITGVRFGDSNISERGNPYYIPDIEYRKIEKKPVLLDGSPCLVDGKTMSIYDASAYSGLSYDILLHWIDKGKIRAFNAYGRDDDIDGWFVYLDSLDKFICAWNYLYG